MIILAQILGLLIFNVCEAGATTRISAPGSKAIAIARRNLLSNTSLSSSMSNDNASSQSPGPVRRHLELVVASLSAAFITYISVSLAVWWKFVKCQLLYPNPSEELSFVPSYVTAKRTFGDCEGWAETQRSWTRYLGGLICERLFLQTVSRERGEGQSGWPGQQFPGGLNKKLSGSFERQRSAWAEWVPLVGP